MKCLLVSLFLLISFAGYPYSGDNTEQRNDMAYGEYTAFKNTIPSEETYRAIQPGMPNQNGRLRAGSEPEGAGDDQGTAISGVDGAPVGNIAIIPILLLAVAYGLRNNCRRKKAG